MTKLAPITKWNQRMAEAIFPMRVDTAMLEEIEALRERVTLLESMLPKPSNRCDDEECGDGYGCICYTR